MNQTSEPYAEFDEEEIVIDIHYIVLSPKPGLSSLCGLETAAAVVSAVAAVASAAVSVWDKLYPKVGSFYIYFKNNTMEPIQIQFYKKGLIYKKKELITIQPLDIGGYFVFTARHGLLGKTNVKCLVKYETNKSVRFFAFGKVAPREKNVFEVESDGVYLRSAPEVRFPVVSEDDIDDGGDTESL